MRRLVFCVLVLSTILVIAERRLSDGGSYTTEDPTPALWEPVHHPAWTPATPGSNCAFVMSADRSSPYRFTSIEDGVRFDIDADGDLERVSWTEANSDVAFLALDLNGDGRITSGRELIGEHTLPGARNGPSALIAFATDALGGERRGVVDSENPLFFKLLLWTDTDHNGTSDAAELTPAHHVVSDIGLGYLRQHRRDRHGNESRYRGFVHLRTAVGPDRASSSEDDFDRRRSMYEVCLVTR
jgi:hypothetical protein